MSSLTHDQLKILEQTRQRLVQLTQSLGSLVNNINQSDPLPVWSSLQSQATIISNNLLTVSQQLSDNRDVLSSLVAYPTTSFPGRTESAMLGQLLRTKLEPRVEDWVARGRALGNNASAPAPAPALALDGSSGDTELSATELAELWNWAPVEANMEARRRNWGGDYTIEEREMGLRNVVTGLKRKLEEESEGEEDEEDEEDEEEDEEGEGGDEMEVVGVRKKPDQAGVEFDILREGSRLPSRPVPAALPLDDVFRFMMTGAVPRSR
ncbi:hypothetical protein AJ80_07157 [Polytolypa hystricis UAMH7299]|uniref:Mediator of RNA polymerase II transcription subunit 8 n=1 Tax=Polytolypa hystricis (strain UAMH7299) TaxID=1447883 RepID=A0A2B7XQA6_POLH7|nr:hypothetical protein AJ80_07157 [Polytolypa hystricis UAMH7299]